MKNRIQKQEYPGVLVSISPAGESDSLIRFFTPEQGGLSVRARGLSKPASKLAPALKAACELQLSLTAGRGGFPVLTGVTVSRDHPGWRDDLDLLALYWFFAECAAAGSGDAEDNRDVYQLLVNLLRSTPATQAKYGAAAIFCLKLLALHGLLPDLMYCSVDGQRLADDEPAFLLPSVEGLVGREGYNRLYARTGGALLRLNPAVRRRWTTLLRGPLLNYGAAGADMADAAILIQLSTRVIADLAGNAIRSAGFLTAQWKLPAYSDLLGDH